MIEVDRKAAQLQLSEHFRLSEFLTHDQVNMWLIGGAGIYRDNGAHGPFIHIDTRGSRARW